MYKVIISILNYNNSQDTIDCLDSIRKLSLRDVEVTTYVLDNGSKEKFIVDTDKYKDINLVSVRSEINTGFTGGHNYIYKKSKELKCDFLLLLNNDCILDKECIKELVGGIKKNVVASVPKIYFTKGREYHKERYKKEDLGNIIWYAGGKMDWGNVVSRHIGLDEVDRGQFDQRINIDFATGACLLLRSDIIGAIGLFDDKYFLYYEDADLSARIIKSGYKIEYIPKAIVWHNNAGSSGSGSKLHDYYLTRNKLLFGMRYASLKVKILLLREGLKLLAQGRKWQKVGVRDYFIGKFGKGSYEA